MFSEKSLTGFSMVVNPSERKKRWKRVISSKWFIIFSFILLGVVFATFFLNHFDLNRPEDPDIQISRSIQHNETFPRAINRVDLSVEGSYNNTFEVVEVVDGEERVWEDVQTGDVLSYEVSFSTTGEKDFEGYADLTSLGFEKEEYETIGDDFLEVRYP